MEDGKPKQVPAYPNATDGPQLLKTLYTIQQKYGVAFMFCDPADTGETIVKLLGGDTGE